MKRIIAAIALVSSTALAAPPLDTVQATALVVPNQTGYVTMYVTEQTVIRALALSWKGDEFFNRSVGVFTGPTLNDLSTARILYIAHVPVTTYIQFPKDGIILGVNSYVWVQAIDDFTMYVITQPESYQLVTYTDKNLSLKTGD